VQPGPPGEHAVDDGGRVVQALAAERREADGERADPGLVPHVHLHPLEPVAAVHPHLAVMDHHVRHGLVLEEALHGVTCPEEVTLGAVVVREQS